jgi:hypothetical protein
MTHNGDSAERPPHEQQSKLQELADEFRSVVGARQKALDWLLPPLVFLPIQAWLGLTVAAAVAVVLAIGIVGWRAVQGMTLRYALAGLAGVLVAIGAALISRQAAGFLIPSIITSGANALLCLVSVALSRPLVAWTSHIARGWTLEWYWHPRVRPAYTAVTLAWALFFGLRGALQIAAYLSGLSLWLTLVSVLGGWPSTILLLVASYLYGTWRLKQLGGPSVKEFDAGEPPPWQGQRRGF